jgi:arylsulfatase A-like enzyme/Flp pilus assembly protein TadD
MSRSRPAGTSEPSVTRRRILSAAAVSALALPLAGCAAPALHVGALTGWNVLLVTIDTLRADHVGFAGCKEADTPVMDRLAARGVAFETAVSAAPVTLPSHATILTGLYPPRHGALDNGLFALPEGSVTLAGALRDEGYDTAAFVGAHVLHRQYGLDQGFAWYGDRFRQARAERRAGTVVERATEWLGRRDRSRPFFLWAHFYDPHAPYDPPPSFRARFPASPYDGEIAYADSSLGALLAAVKAQAALDRTLVVVTSDHGEAFGDGGELTHGILLREATLRVPLVLDAAGRIGGGRRVKEVVSLADVFPTVLELLGVPVPADLDGVSLVTALDGRGEVAPRTVYSETTMPQDELGWSPMAGARDARWARVVSPIPELYDLRSDPRQLKNLDGAAREESDRLDRFVEKVRSRARQIVPRTMSRSDVEALEALGYVVGAKSPTWSGDDPKLHIALWRRMNALREALRRGEDGRVLSEVEVLLAEDPENPLLRSLRGQARVATGRFDDGIDDLRAAFEATGSIARDGTLLARSLAQAGRVDESEALLRTFVAAEPLDANHRFNLGLMLLEAGRLTEARDAFEAAHELNPMAVDVLANLALVHAQLRDDPERAITLIDRAIELARNDDRPRQMKADVLEALGRREER